MKCFNNRAAVYFSPNAGRLALQTLGSLDELYEAADTAEETLQKIGTHLADLTGGTFHLGPRKNRHVAEDKIARDYGGKTPLLTDVVRAKLVITSADSLAQLIEILNPENDTNHSALRDYNAYSAQMSNYFAEPKFETGYRALNVKLALPLDETGDEYYLVELQVVHEDIEAVYDKTHHHMREAQNIASKFRHTRIPNGEAMRMAAHYAVCRYENGLAAKKARLDCLLKDQEDALTDRDELSLKNTIAHYFEL